MALQKTAHDACSRKVHCVMKKYLDDPFVSFFAKDTTIVNSPLMNRGTWLRTTAIESSIRTFAKDCQASAIQVISFGAGVDTLYFRLRKFHPEVKFAHYIELDFPDLVEEKDRIIKKHAEFHSLVGDAYSLLPCDLRNPTKIAELLRQHAESGVPTILLAEMVFVYIETSITTELLQKTLEVLGTGTSVGLITYDAMRPTDRFGEMMLDNLAAIGVHLCGIKDLPTPEAHEDRCKQVGLTNVKAMSMRQLYLSVPREQQVWLNKLEMIDDWDEWNLVHDHYCFVVAATPTAPLPVGFPSS